MTPEDLKGGQVKSTEKPKDQPPNVSTFVPKLEEGVWVYNPTDGRELLTCDKDGVKAAKDGAGKISGKSNDGWIVKMETVEGVDGVSQGVLSLRWGHSGDKGEVFANAWKLEKSIITPLDKNGRLPSLQISKGVAVIPFPPKKDRAGGVLVAQSDELFKPQSQAVIKTYL